MRRDFNTSRVVRFIRVHGGKCYSLVSDEKLKSYLSHAADTNRLFMVARGDQIEALSVASYQEDPDQGWPDNSVSNLIYIETLISTTSEALVGVINLMQRAFPNWDDCNLAVHRRGKLKRITPEYVSRFKLAATRKMLEHAAGCAAFA